MSHTALLYSWTNTDNMEISFLHPGIILYCVHLEYIEYITNICLSTRFSLKACLFLLHVLFEEESVLFFLLLSRWPLHCYTLTWHHSQTNIVTPQVGLKKWFVTVHYWADMSKLFHKINPEHRFKNASQVLFYLTKERFKFCHFLPCYFWYIFSDQAFTPNQWVLWASCHIGPHVSAATLIHPGQAGDV